MKIARYTIFFWAQKQCISRPYCTCNDNIFNPQETIKPKLSIVHQTNLLQAVKVKNEVLTSDVRFFWAIQSCCALASSKYLIRNKWNLIQMPTVKSGFHSECIILILTFCSKNKINMSQISNNNLFG